MYIKIILFQIFFTTLSFPSHNLTHPNKTVCDHNLHILITIERKETHKEVFVDDDIIVYTRTKLHKQCLTICSQTRQDGLRINMQNKFKNLMRFSKNSCLTAILIEETINSI